jgi:hypothetical protein
LEVVNIDPITGANQTSGAYCKQFKTGFDECKVVNLEYAVMFMSHTQKAMSTWWGIIQHSVNLCHSYVENIRV